MNYKFAPQRSWAALFTCLCALLLLIGCKRDTTCEINSEVAAIEAPVKVERLEQSFFTIKNEADAQQFLARNPLLANQFLQRRQYPSDAALAATLTRLATNQGLQKLGKETLAEFSSTDTLQMELKQLLQHVRYYFPDFRVPPVKTFVSGLSQDLFVNDSLMVLSLDFFVGPKASYRPNVPAYILRRYTPAHLMPTVAQAISSKYNQAPPVKQQNMLGEMVQLGKSLYFTEKVLPCSPDSVLIGYTATELANLQFNEGKVWAHFIEKNLLYNTSPFTIQKYVSERPNVPEIDKTAPGRIGAWVGWQIVRKYMDTHPEVTLAQLMANKDPQAILNESRYRPKRK
ncbi:gliding motility lipoprotein GldB [Hymenobacter sp. HD11105]